MKSIGLYFFALLFLLGCTLTIPDLPVRETVIPVSVAILVDGVAVNGNPTSGFTRRMRSDITRTRMAIAVEPGEPSRLLLHVSLSRRESKPMRVAWVVTDHRENVIQSGWRDDVILGTGLDERMVSRIVLNEFSKIDLSAFSGAPEIVFIRDVKVTSKDETRKQALRNFPKSETPGAADYAVVVGIEKYRGEFESVLNAENDAIQFTAMLEQTFNIPSKNIKTLINDRATKSDIVAAIYEWLPKRVTKDSRIFVFFSGYGSPNYQKDKPENFLLPYDGTPSYLTTGGIALQELENHLGTLESKNAYLFLDTSFSGMGSKSVSPKGVRPLVPQKEIQTSPSFVFSATADGQNAYIFDEKNNGIFTHFLITGISGAADENGDKSVDISELKNYLESSIREYTVKTNIEQTPTFRSPPEQKLDTKLVNTLNISGQ